jgi:acetylornithine deacetylase/succinyl-diaminopimelate desuccinylase-like protein
MDGQRSRQHSPLRVSSVDNRLHQLQIQFDRDELVDLCNIESPAGRETEVGNFVFEWMQNEGFEPKKIGMFPDRFNVIGTLAGATARYVRGWPSTSARAKSRMSEAGEDVG